MLSYLLNFNIDGRPRKSSPTRLGPSDYYLLDSRVRWNRGIDGLVGSLYRKVYNGLVRRGQYSILHGLRLLGWRLQRTGIALQSTTTLAHQVYWLCREAVHDIFPHKPIRISILPAPDGEDTHRIQLLELERDVNLFITVEPSGGFSLEEERGTLLVILIQNSSIHAGVYGLFRYLAELYLESVDAAPAKPALYYPGHPKKIYFDPELQWSTTSHRSGWRYVLGGLEQLHHRHGTLLDGFLENTFLWKERAGMVVEPYARPWIGFLHNPFELPDSVEPYSNAALFATDAWRASLPYCKGIFCLSEAHRRKVAPLLDPIPVETLIHPTETPTVAFSMKAFRDNPRKKLLQIGSWLRKKGSLGKLKTPGLEKVRIHPGVPGPGGSFDVGGNGQVVGQKVTTVGHLSDSDYDRWLTENLVFLDLYNASACNVVIECIVRNTPILVNRLPALEEYLGPDYPFFYDSLEEAEAKVNDEALIDRTHRYLVALDKSPFTLETFLSSFCESSIYRKLTIEPPRSFVVFAHPRSGSTTLVNILKCLDGVRCLNEPFNPEFWNYIKTHNPEFWNHVETQRISASQYFSNRPETRSELDHALEAIARRRMGLKHLEVQLPPFLNKHLLSCGQPLVFLYRRNLLQTVVSDSVANIAGDWSNDKERLDGCEFPPLSIEDLRERLDALGKSIGHYRTFLCKRNIKHLEVAYEDVFGPEVDRERTLDRLQEIVDFLGLAASIRNELGSVRKFLDSKQQLRGEDLYDNVPNAHQIDQDLGCDGTGYLFPSRRTQARRSVV